MQQPNSWNWQYTKTRIYYRTLCPKFSEANSENIQRLAPTERTPVEHTTILTTIHPKMVNLSRKSSINAHANEILINYGLKFAPVSRTNTTELKANIKYSVLNYDSWSNLQIKKTFDYGSLVKPESTFIPERQRDLILDTYIDLYLTKHPLYNLAKTPQQSKWNLSIKQ